MQHHEMVAKLSKDGKVIAAGLYPNQAHIWHMTSCIMGEAGELLEAHRLGNTTDVKEELGDIAFYVAGIRNQHHISQRMVEDAALEYAQGKGLQQKYQYIDGIVISAAELFDTVKKWIIYEQQLDLKKVVAALGKLHAWVTSYYGSEGFIEEEILQGNMDKLAKRYGADYEYTNEKAKLRADKA